MANATTEDLPQHVSPTIVSRQSTVAGELAVGVAFVGCSRTHVVVNLAARTAGAGITHRPEVVLHAHREDPVLRNTLIAPVLLSFFVAGNALLALKDRAVEFVFGQ